MFRMLTFAALALPSSALACPGAETASLASTATQTVTAADPTHCAKNASLVGTNCSWSTGAMAQRVQAEGRDTAITTRLAAQTAALDSKVAAPYRAGDLYVIANTVIEAANPSDTLSMTGKVLEVDGVKYLLVTSFSKSNS
ncbi:MAG: hypothetical protein ABMA64_35130 [Myxococcota bacterium]